MLRLYRYGGRSFLADARQDDKERGTRQDDREKGARQDVVGKGIVRMRREKAFVKMPERNVILNAVKNLPPRRATIT